MKSVQEAKSTKTIVSRGYNHQIHEYCKTTKVSLFAFTLILNAALKNKKGISTNITRSIVLPMSSSASMRNAIRCFIVGKMLLKHPSIIWSNNAIVL